jgi:hypothetical protein
MAIQMQRIVRGWLTRMRIKLMHEAARVMQKWWRVFFMIKLRAVLIIQRRLHYRLLMYKALMRIKRWGFRWKYRRHRMARKVHPVNACLPLCSGTLRA